MNLKERLELKSERGGGYYSNEDARAILALLAAAKRLHAADVGTTEDDFYAARDDLLNAIHAIERE